MNDAPRKTRSQDGDLSGQEARNVDDLQRLRARVVYEIIRQEGEHELSRPLGSLWWSGLAAGIGISMSVVAEGLLRLRLPAEAEWRPLVENFGYCIGFLLVVLGRLQLFTENTITAVLPLTATRTWLNLFRTLRLWSTVFSANLLGTFVFAASAVYLGIFSSDQLAAFKEVSHHLMAKSSLEMLLHAVPAGFLVAAMVWMMPSSEGSEFWVIVAITYIIALGGFAHVVAGSAEAFLLLLAGEIGLSKALFGFLLPAFAGNLLGGSALFALLAYAQVKEEI